MSRYCNTCRNIYARCGCTPAVKSTVINSDQAGRDGLSAYEIAVRTGQTTASTEAEWIEELHAADGADGDTFIPVPEDNYFDQ